MNLLDAYRCPKVSKPTKAVWHLRSKDKRWRDKGPFIYKGMRGMPVEVSFRIEQLRLKNGEPPEDLEWGFTLGAGKYLFVSLEWWLRGMLDWVEFPKL